MEKIRKNVVVLTLGVLLIVLMLGACGKAEEPAVGMINPFVEVKGEELVQITGLALTPPAGATDVRYSYLRAEPEPRMSQMDFTYNGKSFTYRAEHTGELESYDMTGLYYDWTETSEAAVGYNTAVVQTCDKAGGIYWLDIVPGVSYSLGCNSPVSAEELTELANLIYEPTQGEAYGDTDMEGPTVDYAGTYRDGDASDSSNEVVIVKKDGGYDVTVSIFRLAEFDGVGYNEDGAVYFVLQDPNGKEMTAVFFPAEDDSYILRFMQSEWDLLEAETDFAGFSFVG